MKALNSPEVLNTLAKFGHEAAPKETRQAIALHVFPQSEILKRAAGIYAGRGIIGFHRNNNAGEVAVQFASEWQRQPARSTSHNISSVNDAIFYALVSCSNAVRAVLMLIPLVASVGGGLFLLLLA